MGCWGSLRLERGQDGQNDLGSIGREAILNKRRRCPAVGALGQRVDSKPPRRCPQQQPREVRRRHPGSGPGPDGGVDSDWQPYFRRPYSASLHARNATPDVLVQWAPRLRRRERSDMPPTYLSPASRTADPFRVNQEMGADSVRLATVAARAGQSRSKRGSCHHARPLEYVSIMLGRWRPFAG